MKIQKLGLKRSKEASAQKANDDSCKKHMALIQGDLKRAKTEKTKANADYEALKAEVMKALFRISGAVHRMMRESA